MSFPDLPTDPLSTEQARIVLLEQELDQAAKTIEFMHGCLTQEHYSYAYPEQTLEHLAKIRKLVPEHKGCVHSMFVKDCTSCQDRIIWHHNRHRAKTALALQTVKDQQLATGSGLKREVEGARGIEIAKQDSQWAWQAFEYGSSNNRRFEWHGQEPSEEQAIAAAIVMVGLPE